MAAPQMVAVDCDLTVEIVLHAGAWSRLVVVVTTAGKFHFFVLLNPNLFEFPKGLFGYTFADNKLIMEVENMALEIFRACKLIISFSSENP